MTAHNTCHGCGGLPVRTNGLEHHVIVVGPGRCTECSFHVATQGHRDCSSRTAPVYPDYKPDSLKPDSLTFLERITQRRRELSGEPNRCPPPRRTEDTGDIAQPGHNPAYVAAAIRGDLHRLAAATEGSRNHTLHSVACNIFEFVKGGHANEIAARAELERIATAIGLGHYEIQATLRSAWGRVGPRSVPAPGSVATACTIESPTHSTLFTISGSRPLPSSGALHPQNTGGEFSRGRHRALVALRNQD